MSKNSTLSKKQSSGSAVSKNSKLSLSNQKTNDRVLYCLMVLPTLLVYSIVVYSSYITIELSFFEWDGLNPERYFVGWENYVRLLDDERFLWSLFNIAVLIFATVFIQVFAGAILAFILTDLQVRYTNFFKSVIFLPVVISNVAVALYFVQLYDFENGLLNYLLTSFNLDKINFLGLSENTIYFVVIPQTWQYIGLMFIISYTAFSAVPTDLVDAAQLDGMNMMQRLIYVYVPISWDSLSVCFIIALVGPLKAFEHIQIITNGGGSEELTHIPATLMYTLGFNNFEYGYGSSVATIIFVLALTLVMVFKNLFKRRQALQH